MIKLISNYMKPTSCNNYFFAHKLLNFFDTHGHVCRKNRAPGLTDKNVILDANTNTPQCTKLWLIRYVKSRFNGQADTGFQ